MKNSSKFALILVLIAALVVMVAPTFAADSTKTITIDESTINNSYWVTNPSWRAVSNRSVDLQTGQVVVSETITRRNKTTFDVTITYTPYIDNGRLYWTATAATKDGNPVSAELLQEINDHMNASWRHYIREHKVTGHIASVDVSDSTITLTVTTASIRKS